MFSAPKTRVVKLRSSDNKIFEVAEAMAALSEPIKNLVEVIGVDHVIPMQDVNSKTLAMVIEWWKKHVDHHGANCSSSREQLSKEWEDQFVEALDQPDVVIDLLCTANFLCIHELQDQMFQRVVDFVKVKTLDEICQLFRVDRE